MLVRGLIGWHEPKLVEFVVVSNRSGDVLFSRHYDAASDDASVSLKPSRSSRAAARAIAGSVAVAIATPKIPIATRASTPCGSA